MAVITRAISYGAHARTTATPAGMTPFLGRALPQNSSGFVK
jgi:hypothetical protein